MRLVKFLKIFSAIVCATAAIIVTGAFVLGEMFIIKPAMMLVMLSFIIFYLSHSLEYYIKTEMTRKD